MASQTISPCCGSCLDGVNICFRGREHPIRHLQPLILGFGQPNVDITVEVDQAELAELGLTAGSEIAGASQETKERIVNAVGCNPRREVTPGGAALNSMRVAAWSGKRSIRVAFLGSVGHDDHAQVLVDAMHDVGVVPLLLEVPGQATGVCAALIENVSKDRTLVTVRGAGGAITPSFLATPAVAAALSEASLFYATSFVLTIPHRAACAARMAEEAWTRNVAFSLNLSSSSLFPKVYHEVLRLLPKCRYVFGNVDELHTFARLRGWDDTALDLDLATLLAGLTGPGGAVVVTAGANSTLLARNGCEARTFPVPRVPKDEIVDTNGCGDAFVGGFLSKAVLNVDLSQCIDEGHRCAGLILRRRGCSLDRVCLQVCE